MSKNNIHFEISERKVLLRILDILSVLLVLYAVGYVFNFDYFKLSADNWSWPIVLSIYLTLFATVFELYDLQKSSRFEVVVKNVILTSSVTVLFYLLTPYYTPNLPSNRMQILYFFLSVNVALLVWRYGYICLIAVPRFYKRVLLIAHQDDLHEIVEALQNSDPNYKIVAFLDTAEHLGAVDLPADLEQTTTKEISSLVWELNISEIVVGTRMTDGVTAELNRKLVKLLERGVPIRAFTHVYEALTYRIPVQHVERDFYRFFPFSRSNHNKLYLSFSRLLDVVLSIVGLLIGSLLLPIILIGNLLGNRGPLLYYQTRVGRNGEHFKLYKLRSMVKDAEKNGAQFAQKKDSRITKFGKFLRRSRFDEFPQFVNVLKGDMSIIGPRPERPEFVCKLIEKIPFYEVRHLVKPGITGWAQVNADYGSSEDDALEKLQYDLYYIKHRSLFLDISIVMKTLSTIIFYRGQ